MWFAKLKKEGDELRLPPLPELGKKRVEKPELRVETARRKIELAIEDVPKPPSEFRLEDVPEPPAELELEEVPEPPSKVEIDEFEIPSPIIEKDKIELPLPEAPEVKEDTLPHHNFDDMAAPQKVIKADGKKGTEKRAVTSIQAPKFKVPETVREIPSSPEETSLWLANGMTVKDINELATALKSMDDKTFHYHVNMEKNEIADWVAEILHDESLAQKLAKVHKRKDAYNIVERAIGGQIIRKKKEELKKAEPVSKKKRREIKIGKSPEANHAALEELESMKPSAEVVAEKEKPGDIAGELKTEEKKRKKSALDALTFTLTSLKPATDIIGRAFPRKREEKAPLILEKSQEEIEKAIENVKENLAPISEIPKLEITEAKKAPPKAVKKEKPPKKKKLTKDEKGERMRLEFKALLQKAHDFVGSENFNDAKTNLILAKRLFRNISLGKERKFLEYEIYEIENKIKIKSLKKVASVI